MWKTSKPNIEKLQGKKDVQGLIEALSDQDSTIIAAAAKALGEMGATSAVGPLREKALTGNLAAISALGLIGGPQSIKVLVHLTQREAFPHHVLAGIIQALGKANDPQIVDHIKGFLTSEDDWVLGATLAVLRKFLSEKEVACLIREQKDRQDTDLTKKNVVLRCDHCEKSFTHQQARVDSAAGKNPNFTHYLFLCPECGANLLNSENKPYEKIIENPTKEESEDEK